MSAEPEPDGAPPPKQTALDIYHALKVRHPEPDWVYLPQVRTRTGYSNTWGSDMDSERYLDAFAIHCHRSKGYQRVCYEIKVARSDWLREIEDPRKRTQGYFLSNEFWYAVAPGVVKLPNDLSVSWEDDRAIEGGKKRSYRTLRRLFNMEKGMLDGCGVLEVQPDDTFKVLIPAVKREAWPMPESFVASLLRQAQGVFDPKREEALQTIAPQFAPVGSLFEET